MKNALYAIVLNSLLLMAVCPCGWSQVENFDSVTPPNLPQDWSTSSTQSIVWSIVNDLADTAPNAAFCHGSSIAERSMIYSPAFYAPHTATNVSFRQSYNLESSNNAYYDGGRFYLFKQYPETYGEEYEFTAQGGTFTDSPYNHTISTSFGSFIAGGAAWGGDSGGFTTVTGRLPDLTANRFARFAWALHSDNSVQSTGWWLDSVSINPSINLQLTRSISPSPAIAGQPFTETLTVTNPSSLTATNVRVRDVIPANLAVTSVTTNGSATFSSSQVTATFASISPGASASVTYTGITPQPTGLDASLEMVDGDLILRRHYGLRRVPFSAVPTNGIMDRQLVSSFDFIDDTSDACEYQSFGDLQQGKIGVTNSLHCSITTKALNLQEKGAVAAIIIAASDDLTVPAEIGTGVVIPVYVIAASEGEEFLHSASNNTRVKIETSTDRLVSSAFVLGDQFDPVIANNSAYASTQIVIDSDLDGTVDAQDACPSDPAKSAVGICGCGIADTDSNSNGIADCQHSLDLKAQLQTVNKAVKSLKPLAGLSKKKAAAQKTIRTQIKNIRGNIAAIVKTSGSSITLRGRKKIKTLQSACVSNLKKVVGATAEQLPSYKQQTSQSLSTFIKAIM